MPAGSFGAAGSLKVDGDTYRIFRVDAVDGAARLPFSLKVLLENLLRNEDGHLVTARQIQARTGWDPAAEPSTEIGFTPARVLLQDFTGCHAWWTWPRCGRRWSRSAATPRW